MTYRGMLLLLLLSPALVAGSAICLAGPGIHLLSPAPSRHAEEVGRALVQTLAKNVPEAKVSPLSLEDLERMVLPESDLVVAIGVDATRAALQSRGHNPLLSLLIPRLAWEELAQEFPDRGRRRAVIYVDQPIDRLLALSQVLVPDLSQVGTVFGHTSTAHSQRFQAAAASRGLALHQAELAADQNPIAVITPIVQASEVFVAVPDQAAFNRHVAKWVLYLSYRRKIPVIGFSRSYTEAGALASVYSLPDEIGRQGGEWLVRWLTGNEHHLYRAYDPAYYQVQTNSAVARALGIDLPDNNQIISALDKMVPTEQ